MWGGLELVGLEHTVTVHVGNAEQIHELIQDLYGTQLPEALRADGLVGAVSYSAGKGKVRARVLVVWVGAPWRAVCRGSA